MTKLEFPNPQKIRKNWMDLNGTWQFKFAENESEFKKNPLPSYLFDKEINVPYSYLFKKSLISETKYYPVIWYRRTFEYDLKTNSSYLLNFEAIDYSCDIWLNDQLIFSHVGGHTPFEIDITEFIETSNELVIRVEDYNSTTQPIGKQSWKDNNFLCWYTRTIGIWQNVWLEETGPIYITSAITKTDIHRAELNLDIFINKNVPAKVEVDILYNNQLISTASCMFKNNRAKFSVDVSCTDADFRLFYWHPDNPNLYDIVYKVIYDNNLTDSIESYFGMRHIESHKEKIYLNDQEFYQKLILNQGYYFEGGMTGTNEEFLNDLTKVKEMGFNGIRMHQKVESHKVAYLCDTLGLVMWAEMPSFFEFSHISIENMYSEISDFVHKHINHPSVITYVAMNESWGINEISQNIEEQNFVNSLYYAIKSLDSSCLVIGNDGWEQTFTDICTIHDYNSDSETLLQSYTNKEAAIEESPSLTSGRKTYCDGYQDQRSPYVISEYGGIAYQDDLDCDTWGYGERISSKNDVIKKISELTTSIMKIDYVTGFCYTQLTDVEQEVNGLLNNKHEYKFDPQLIRDIVASDRNYGFIFK